MTFSGRVYAASSFYAKQRLAQVLYLGGSSLGVAWDDRHGTIGSQTWSFPASASVTDEVSRSVAGRIVRESVSQGGRLFKSAYGYDAAGRLVSATIPGHELSYEFASSRGCGPNTAAKFLESGCMFVFGVVGTACSIVKGIGYALLGHLTRVAIEAAGAVTGGRRL